MAKEITNEQLFEFMTKMYGDLSGKIDGVDNKVEDLKLEVGGLKGEVKSLNDRVTIIEQEHGKKLDALFDGYKQNSDKLDRIEREVSRHEEIILRRVK